MLVLNLQQACPKQKDNFNFGSESHFHIYSKVHQR